MTAIQLLLIILAYFALLMAISYLTSRNNRDTTYFDGNRSSPWMLVAFGMIGSGISAVSLVSIPGDVGNNNLYYFQFILGTLAGSLFVAFILIPVYFRLKLVSIYGYLAARFGPTTYKTGSDGGSSWYLKASVRRFACSYPLRSCSMRFLMPFMSRIG